MNNRETEVVVTAKFDDQASVGMAKLAADLNALSGAGAAVSNAEAGMAEALKSAEEFRSQYSDVMSGMAEDVNASLTYLIEGGYLQLAKAMATLGQSGTDAARIFGKAMLELSARAILAIGQQAAVKAVFALAEGLLFKDPTALVAAKLYGAVAGMALVTGAAMLGAAGRMDSDSGGGGGSSRGTSGRYSSAESSEQSQPNIIVNVVVEGHVVDTRAFVEEHVAPALAEAVGRGVASRGKYNLVVTKD